MRVPMLFAVVVLLSAPRAEAQALAQPGGRLTADVVSYATVGLGIALDARASWNTPNRARAFELQGARLGISYAGVALLKHVFPRVRPCAPACGIDQPATDFPSGHAWFASQAVDTGPRLLLAMSTADLRLLAGKHDVVGIVGGLVGGLLTSRIR